jgi:hypothetical protein
MFLAASLIVIKYPSIVTQINKCLYVHLMGYYSVIKITGSHITYYDKNELL